MSLTVTTSQDLLMFGTGNYCWESKPYIHVDINLSSMRLMVLPSDSDPLDDDDDSLPLSSLSLSKENNHNNLRANQLIVIT